MLTVRKILCPTDFSDPSREALSTAEAMAKLFDAELIVCHVVEPAIYPVAVGLPPTAGYDLEKQAFDAAEERLGALVQELGTRGLRASARVESGPAWQRLGELVKEQGIDMVVLATHGLTGLAHVLLGSTAERLVRTCPCPVLTVKAHLTDQED